MIVEDGTGLSKADSYVSVKLADDYYASRSESAWEDIDSEIKESLLIKATDFVDCSFEWNGVRKTQSQGLKFPRKQLVDSDGLEVEGVPIAVKQAVIIAALLFHKEGELFKEGDENGDVVSERVGSISYTYDTSSKKDTTVYDAINTRLRGLYKDRSKKGVLSSGVSRA